MSMLQLRNEGPIGVFDSGLGGLTALAELQRRLPQEDFVYLGDTARAPYGTRSRQTILNYARACARALRDHRIKLLVFTCHTAAAVALEQLSAELFVPAIDPIATGIGAALGTNAKRLGVLASSYLVHSDHFHAALGSQSNAVATVHPCQLLSSFADEPAWPLDAELRQRALIAHLRPALEAGAQVVLLANSRLNMLQPVIEASLAAMDHGQVAVVDSARTLADAVMQQVEARQLATARTDPGKLRVVFTDLPHDLSIAERYFGRPFADTTIATIDL